MSKELSGKRRVRVLGPALTPRGPGYAVKSEDTDAVDVMVGLRDGEAAPLGMEAVMLRQVQGNLYDCEVLAGHKGRMEVIDATKGRKGPAQVATDAYRDNWDKIFGSRKDNGAAN
jgi:hypothetical protein